MAQDELFPLVDEAGNTIGKATRGECHSGTKLLHPVVHLHLTDNNGNLFLQKRSMHKDIQPGKWDTAVGGHVDFGEDITSAMLRESREEIGISGFEYTHIFSYVFESEIERELVNTFIARNFTGSINVDHDEVDEGRFWSITEIEQNIGKNVFTPNFEQEFVKLKNYL